VVLAEGSNVSFFMLCLYVFATDRGERRTNASKMADAWCLFMENPLMQTCEVLIHKSISIKVQYDKKMKKEYVYRPIFVL